MKKSTFRIQSIALVVGSICGAVNYSWAATINAASCSQSAVQTAINSASNGDTIKIPAGSCTWGTTVSLNASSRNLNLQGSGIGNTIITAGTAPMLNITGAQGYKWTLSDLTIVATASGQEVVTIGGTSKNWRVHHINFTNTGNTLFLFTIGGGGNLTYGVLDHLTVTGNNSGIASILGGGFPQWADPTYSVWGDEKAIFLEDSSITMNDHHEGRFTIDCTNGGRYVLRNNTITNQRTGNHGLDSGGYSSCLSVEIYNNSFKYTSTWPTISAVVFLRGGTALIHNNTFNYSSSTWIGSHLQLINYRGRNPDGSGGGSVGWPYCTGTQYRWNSSVNQNWSNAVTSGGAYFSTSGKWKMCSGNRLRLCETDSTCSANGEGTCTEYVDGTAGNGSYPCFQQVGRGTNNMLNPAYEWNNTFFGGQGSSGCSSSSCNVNFSGENTIQLNRDFYNDTQKSGYKPYTYPHPLQEGEGSSTTIQPPTVYIVN